MPSKDLIHIPDHVGRGALVLRLSEGIANPEGIVKHYQVTPRLAGRFDEALNLSIWGKARCMAVSAGGTPARRPNASSSVRHGAGKP